MLDRDGQKLSVLTQDKHKHLRRIALPSRYGMVSVGVHKFGIKLRFNPLALRALGIERLFLATIKPIKTLLSERCLPLSSNQKVLAYKISPTLTTIVEYLFSDRCLEHGL